MLMEPYLKTCKKCEEPKPISDFGRNAVNDNQGARDGLNVWCKICVNTRVALSRENRRNYNARNGRNDLLAARASQRERDRRAALMELEPCDRVLAAIRFGAQTLKEIAKELPRMSVEDITDCIAELLLWDHRIRTREVRGMRMYFINASRQPQRKPMVPVREPRSYGVSNIYSAGEPDIVGMSTRYLRNKVA